jgi:hypothetical protein
MIYTEKSLVCLLTISEISTQPFKGTVEDIPDTFEYGLEDGGCVKKNEGFFKSIDVPGTRHYIIKVRDGNLYRRPLCREEI